MLRYNLKWILLEEDDIDLVDTSFQDKWDEVPKYEEEYHDGSDAATKHDEYWHDLDNHITDRLRSYVKDNPAVLDSLPSPSGGRTIGMTPHPFFRPKISAKGPDWVQEYMDSRDDDRSWAKNHHPKNVRAATWIKEFNKFLEEVKSDPKSDEYFTGRWDVPNLGAWRYDDED